MVEKRFFGNRFIVTRFIITLQKIEKKSFFSSYLLRTDTVIPANVSPLVVRASKDFSLVTKVVTHFKLTLRPGLGLNRVLYDCSIVSTHHCSTRQIFLTTGVINGVGGVQ